MRHIGGRSISTVVPRHGVARVLLVFLVWAWPVAGAAQAPPSGPDMGEERVEPIDVHAIDPATFRAIAYRLQPGQAPRIDGRLDEEVWQLAPVSGGFFQREPHFAYPASERTEFRILYDDRMIYFGIWCYDSDPDGILASELKRDANLGKGDQIKIAIDTFNDRRNAYIFFTNPLGAYKDANSSENGRVLNYDWNGVWENKTSVDEHGWYAEIAIPLSQLRFRTAIGESPWGLNISRVIRRKNEDAYWVPFPREWGLTGMLRMSSAGYIDGLRDLRSRRRLELVPFLTPTIARDRATGLPASKDAGAGFDLRVGLTGELTADLTYNTDFAQVEADQEVVNLTRFSLFFPEKRQFFTESGAIFDYGRATATGGSGVGAGPGLLSLFYSRRIGLVDGQEVPIVGGGKVTGRAGQYALGLINITTDDAPAGPGANFTALRVKRSVLARSSIGAVLLNSEGGLSDYNRSAGIDGGFLFGRHLSMTGLFAATLSAPGAVGGTTAATTGYAGVADVTWQTDRAQYNAAYTDIGRTFNAEMGFVPRVDIRSTRLSAGWSPRPRWRGVRQLQTEGSFAYFENHDGRVESRTYAFDARLQRQDSSSIRFNLTRDYDFLPAGFPTAGTRLAPGGYEWTVGSVGFNTNQSRRVYGGATLETGGYYSGDRQSIRGNLNFLIGKTLLFEPNYTHNRITLPGRPLYTSNVLNFRVSHSFSPDIFWKGFFQYNDERRSANFNFLFWYVYRPGSDLYIVYNHGWDTRLPDRHHTWVERNRSLAVKMTYWLSR